MAVGITTGIISSVDQGFVCNQGFVRDQGIVWGNSVSHFGNDFLDPGQEVCDVSVDTGGALARASFAIRHNTSEVETPLPLADKWAARVSLHGKT